MNDAAIGVFDSGMGGLTCVKELNHLMPNENIIYFGDTARIPYGTRGKETIIKYAEQDIKFIKKHNIKMIIAACGTVSSVLGTSKTSDADIPFTGVLLPTVQAACAKTKNGKIGVIGTNATIKSGAYGKAIRSIRSDVNIVGKSCPLFVPLVENGFIGKDDPVTKLVVERYLEPVKKEGVDTLILGCTHYPILIDAIKEYMGSGVELISSGSETAKYVCAFLTAREMLAERSEQGVNEYYCTDSAEMFAENAESFCGGKLNGLVTRVSMDELAAE